MTQPYTIQLQKRAFLRGRIGLGMQPLLPSLLAGGVSFALGKPLQTVVLATLALAFASGAAFFFGQGFRKGTVLGFRAGCVAFFAPVLAGHSHCEIGGQCVAYCLLACLAAGVFSGGYVGFSIARKIRSHERISALGFAAIVCVSLGFLGCTMVGVSSAYNLAAGFALGSLPVLVVKTFAKSTEA